MEDLKQIEKDLSQGLERVDLDENNAPGAVPIVPAKDFIQDDVLNFLLGYKNKLIVGVLGKGLGEKANALLSDLYQVSDTERILYKTAIQDFIRENFPEWEEKIAKFTSAAIAGLAILELGRLHEAKQLIRAELSNQDKKSNEAA